MYCMQRITDPAAIQAVITQAPPFGPGWDPAVMTGADALEIWATTITDPTDYVAFRLMHGSQILRELQIPGY
ncbi:hypothetical protein SAMN00768000_0272 [Sulfobacillus thermosulfidooxidans DSM 9293]|uniref:Uncharacterized protein n=1 Tax=Sulfobacillus thermosulfidooxidans (strain DSM 9293 / VKM B-1269 / AT-1) TaxID=929705 RepID=A0A1W1W6X7_SULTA|nr:hypothetical protein [Sulfobacillus thermosulfidooxidans]SMC02061.1 hypothetical protein SAMN00768000_0272 [Sulfobacillus thermosulfidooxidans DSM 9293]